MNRTVAAVLLGRERSVSVGFLGLATAFGLAAVTSAAVGHYVTAAALGAAGRVWMVFVPIFCLLAAFQAYRNEGLVVSVALVFAPVFGSIAHGGGIALFGRPTPLESFAMGVRIGGGVAVVLGTVSFIVGIVARRVVGRGAELHRLVRDRLNR